MLYIYGSIHARRIFRLYLHMCKYICRLYMICKVHFILIDRNVSYLIIFALYQSFASGFHSRDTVVSAEYFLLSF